MRERRRSVDMARMFLEPQSSHGLVQVNSFGRLRRPDTEPIRKHGMFVGAEEVELISIQAWHKKTSMLGGLRAICCPLRPHPLAGTTLPVGQVGEGADPRLDVPGVYAGTGIGSMRKVADLPGLMLDRPLRGRRCASAAAAWSGHPTS